MRHFSDWIQAYLSLVSGRSEAPEVFHRWSAISTIGGAVTRHVYIDERPFYRFFPNFYIVLAAPPGVAKKSTTADLCLGLLRDVRPDRFGPDESTWPDMAQSLANHISCETDPADENNDDLLTKKYDVQCAMTLCLREFGTFLKPNDQDMVEGLTDLWDCPDRPHEKSTKTSGVDTIQNPFLNIIGCATSEWLRHNFIQYAGWGIASRIIFVHSEGTDRDIWSPSRLIDLTTWEIQANRLRSDLEHMMTLRGPCIFTSNAQAAAKDWYTKIKNQLREYSASDRPNTWLLDFLARKQAHVHKLALVLSVSRRDTLVIEPEDYMEAVSCVDAVENEIKSVFGIQLAPSAAAVNERAIFDMLHAELSNGLAGRASKNYVYNRIATYVDGSTAERVLSSFTRRGILHEEINRSGTFITLPDEDPFEVKH